MMVGRKQTNKFGNLSSNNFGSSDNQISSNNFDESNNQRCYPGDILECDIEEEQYSECNFDFVDVETVLTRGDKDRDENILRPENQKNSNGKFQCPKCSRVYSRQGYLINHQRIQCGKIPQYKCPYCDDVAFYFKNNLVNHLKKHSHPNDKSNVVVKKENFYPIDSGSQLPKEQPVLLRKKRKQNQKKSCPQCLKKFSLLGNLRKHQKFECGKVPQLQCSYCNGLFFFKGALMRHNMYCSMRTDDDSNNLSKFSETEKLPIGKKPGPKPRSITGLPLAAAIRRKPGLNPKFNTGLLTTIRRKPGPKSKLEIGQPVTIRKKPGPKPSTFLNHNRTVKYFPFMRKNVVGIRKQSDVEKAKFIFDDVKNDDQKHQFETNQVENNYQKQQSDDQPMDLSESAKNKNFTFKTERKKYRCSKCSLSYASINNLKYHEKHKCGGKLPEHKCTICDRLYYHPSSLSFHMKKKHRSNPATGKKKSKAPIVVSNVNNDSNIHDDADQENLNLKQEKESPSQNVQVRPILIQDVISVSENNADTLFIKQEKE